MLFLVELEFGEWLLGLGTLSAGCHFEFQRASLVALRGLMHCRGHWVRIGVYARGGLL